MYPIPILSPFLFIPSLYGLNSQDFNFLVVKVECGHYKSWLHYNNDTKTQIYAAPPIQSPWSRQPQPLPLMGFSGGGLYGNQDVGRYLLDSEPKKKKYAKEAWPGMKPTAHLLL